MLVQLAQGIFCSFEGGHEMSLLSQKFKFLRKKDVSPSGHQITEDGKIFIVTVGLTIKLSAQRMA